MSATVADLLVKEQVHDAGPKRIKALKFGVLSGREIVQQAVSEICDRNLYNIPGPGEPRRKLHNGPLDPRLGTSKDGKCETCGEDIKGCNGHFGYFRLALPAFHIGYLKFIIEVLNCICKKCSRVLLPENERRTYLRIIRRPNLDTLQRQAIFKRVAAACRKCKVCLYCNETNGPVRKVPGHPLKIIHIQYEAYMKSNAKSKVMPAGKLEFDTSFASAKEANPEIEKFLRNAADDMHAVRVLNLFKRISNTDCEIIGVNPKEGRPEMFIWQYIPAPPVAIRPSVQQELATNEDDITNKLGDIIQISNLIRAAILRGQPLSAIMEQWDFMQLQIAMYINSDVPGLQKPEFGRAIRGFCQRLKGKQGRFRGNLSGKRVDFSGRTVIGPDPNLSIEEVAVPIRVAMNMTYPERVNRYNIEAMKTCIRRGPWSHPGANHIVKQNNRRIVLEVLARFNKLEQVAQELQIGDVVERHMRDGDIVLFNRQPSLHKLSILSHKAKIRPGRTFRLNECVCNPYNADFDGDEMNLHLPQTEEARIEATELMGVKHNIVTPKNGTVIIAAIQDFITAAYLLSRKDRFFDRRSFTQVLIYLFNGLTIVDPNSGEPMPIELPHPAVMKPEALWTGKQVFNVLMRPNRKMNTLVNLEAECKEYRKAKGQIPDMDVKDAYLVIRNSEVMCGVMDKSTVGDGKKHSLFYVLLRDYGPDYAVNAMNGLARVSARWLANIGFSIGISDVQPGNELNRRKRELISRAYSACEDVINEFQSGKLVRAAGCTEEQTMEIKLSGILSTVRQEAGNICFDELSRNNAPLTMAKCGSKGSNVNISQMVAGVGQQILANNRISNGFQDRTLPHFLKFAREPASKGFVSNSFYTGLEPTEFIFHAMTGREGLVDTAVKTAETGYMSRRLMKSLEDLSSGYDGTVRTSSNSIVQFQFGDDQLDPADMEGSAKPVNFERTFVQSVMVSWNNDERGLLPWEVLQLTREMLELEKVKYQRYTLLGDLLPYEDPDPDNTDEQESARQFLREIQDGFLRQKAWEIFKTRASLGLMNDYDEIFDMLHARGTPEYEARRTKLNNLVNNVIKISATTLRLFIVTCLQKYKRSMVQPGHAVGAVGAHSIGEPGTQMTLKTFHFAGVAGMSITQGVPRIKEIINASKTISTPVISCQLENKSSEQVARIVQGRIEKTFLYDVIRYIEDVWYADGCYLNMRVDTETIENLQLDVTIPGIVAAIAKSKLVKVSREDIQWKGNRIRIYVPMGEDGGAKKRGATGGGTAASTSTRRQRADDDYFTAVQSLRRSITNVVISGYPDASRAIISKSDRVNPATGTEDLSLVVEGYGLLNCMTTEGVVGTRTKSNSVMEMRDVLGIEAARRTIVHEISEVMATMDIDPRHMQLLADVMTFKGDVLGITRFGLAKMRDSVLQLASFEKTPDHLFEAAWRMKTDKVEGVSECIILGQTVKLGTGALSVVRNLNLADGQVGQKSCLFEDACSTSAVPTRPSRGRKVARR